MVSARSANDGPKLLLLRVNVPSAGNYSLRAAAPPTGTLAPSIPTATATFVIGGATYTATLPVAASADRWLSGPLAYEGRSVVAPISAASVGSCSTNTIIC